MARGGAGVALDASGRFGVGGGRGDVGECGDVGGRGAVGTVSEEGGCGIGGAAVLSSPAAGVADMPVESRLAKQAPDTVRY